MNKIIKCTYGTSDKNIDVTEKFISLYSNNKPVVINNKNFSDPCHGKFKFLNIIYVDENNQEKNIQIKENSIFIDFSNLD